MNSKTRREILNRNFKDNAKDAEKEQLKIMFLEERSKRLAVEKQLTDLNIELLRSGKI